MKTHYDGWWSTCGEFIPEYLSNTQVGVPDWTLERSQRNANE